MRVYVYRIFTGDYLLARDSIGATIDTVYEPWALLRAIDLDRDDRDAAEIMRNIRLHGYHLAHSEVQFEEQKRR